jgi:phosphatidylserine/phosphatidylglycerophosphate/cardiolipin synthase-like enzyme
MGLTLAAALAGPTQTLPARGTVQVAFTPGGDPGALVSQAIHKARAQVQVQAYSFTHKRIADALVEARRRGIDVQLIADQEQSVNIATSLVADLARQGVPVWLDGQHAAAHDKVMIIDAGLPSACVITGSFNFTHAGQYRNAENALLLCDNPDLAETYAANWRRHKSHAQPLRIAP